MRLVIVSGLSGSGKSEALRMLEDLGYFCIDNIPLGLLRSVTEQTLNEQDEQYSLLAVGVDARAGSRHIDRFPQQLAALRTSGPDLQVLFLDAADEVILRRYSETRRKHPLSDADTPLAEAIVKERELLAPIAQCADIVIDTSNTTIHQLREAIRTRVHGGRPGTLSILFQSFGFKHGVPDGADFIFDVRCLPNPHWDETLRDLTGRDQAVIDYLEDAPEVARMLRDISSFLEHWLPAFRAENRSYITIAIGCTGGRHRSVYLAEELAAHFREHYEQVLVRHSELP